MESSSKVNGSSLCRITTDSMMMINVAYPPDRMNVTLRGVSVGGVWLDSEIQNVARKNTTHAHPHARPHERTHAHTHKQTHTHARVSHFGCPKVSNSNLVTALNVACPHSQVTAHCISIRCNKRTSGCPIHVLLYIINMTQADICNKASLEPYATNII